MRIGVPGSWWSVPGDSIAKNPACLSHRHPSRRHLALRLTAVVTRLALVVAIRSRACERGPVRSADGCLIRVIPGTYVERRAYRWHRLASRRISRFTNGFFLAGVFGLLLTGSAPLGNVSDTYSFLIYAFLRCSFIVWGLFLLVHLAARGMLAWKGAHQPRASWTWLVVPVSLMCFWLLHHYGVVCWARWYVSRGGVQASCIDTNKRVAARVVRVVLRYGDTEGPERFDDLPHRIPRLVLRLVPPL